MKLGGEVTTTATTPLHEKEVSDPHLGAVITSWEYDAQAR
jgi:hypothetical protein